MTGTLTVLVEKLLWRGRGLARLESGQIVILEPGVLPGETVQARIVKTSKDYILAQAEKTLTPSSWRQAHPCPHARQCGGSAFGMVNQETGLGLKKEILADALRRALGGETAQGLLEALQIHSSPQGWRYRWRGQIHVHNKCAHAMAPSSNTPVPLTDCHLLAAPLAQALPALAADLPDGRFTIAASPVTGQVAHEKSSSLLPFALPAFGLTLDLSASSFFQANWALNQKLVNTVAAAVHGKDRIADVFAGSGNFALPLASQGKTILAVEGSAKAVQLGQTNARRHKLSTITFCHANLTQPKSWEQIRSFAPQAVIVDPPRTGAKGIGSLLLNFPGLCRMVWISCDVVATLRDTQPLLAAGWRISSLALFDMFPRTWHMEVLMVLDQP